LWLLLLAGRGTPVGQLLHQVLVQGPARRLSRITRGQVMLALLLGVLVIGLVWLLEEEGRLLVAMGLPEVASYAAAVDLAGFLDLAGVAFVAAGSVRVRALFARLRQRPIRARRPKQRSTRPRRVARGANDDEGRPALAA
jgi:hypothetical protein